MENEFEEFDNLIDSLRRQGLTDPANRLHSLLHETAWTTGSELLGELRNEIRKIWKQYKKELSAETKARMRICLRGINRVLPTTAWSRLTDLFIR